MILGRSLPGADLIERGIADLEKNRESVESLLVSIGYPRLRASGISFTKPPLENAEHRLYALLAAEDEDSAHSRYNALIPRLASFENAIECVG